jgi:hypothetical protein
MAENFLEKLVAEWYEFSGYFIKRNVQVGKLSKGGYECELDIVAFNPSRRHLVHIEPSTDADSWEVRDRRYAKKFAAGRRYVPALFAGFNLPEKMDQQALFLLGSKRTRETVGGGRVVLLSEFLEQIFLVIKPMRLASHAIPEHYPLLRTIQLVNDRRQIVEKVWSEGKHRANQ